MNAAPSEKNEELILGLGEKIKGAMHLGKLHHPWKFRLTLD